MVKAGKYIMCEGKKVLVTDTSECTAMSPYIEVKYQGKYYYANLSKCKTLKKQKTKTR